MSILNRGTELVKVFQQVQAVEIDSDGNRISRPALIGTLHRAVVQPIEMQSANTENMEIGYVTTTKYRLRLIGYQGVLGARSQVEWNGRRYSIEGEAKVYNSSPRTKRVEYVMTSS
ncbi:hypothetical protein BH11ACT6_BH11ACT6_29900 [soil metagenome]